MNESAFGRKVKEMLQAYKEYVPVAIGKIEL